MTNKPFRLKLEVYRALGVDLVEQNGRFVKALVKNNVEIKSIPLNSSNSQKQWEMVNDIWNVLCAE